MRAKLDKALIPYSQGLDLPGKRPGVCKGEELQAWVRATETLLGRGLTDPMRIANVLGIAPKTAQWLVEKVFRTWQEGLSKERANWRRERLYQEMEEVASQAFREAMDTEDVGDKVSLLKVVIEANKRRSALCGLDSKQVVIEANVKTTQVVDLVATVEDRFKLPAGALGSIGRDVAMLLSVPEDRRQITAPSGRELVPDVVEVRDVAPVENPKGVFRQLFEREETDA